jgi:hypothetical protein
VRLQVLALALCAACGSSESGEETDPPPPPPTFDYPLDDTLRFHHLQALSTHNSYHVETEGNELVDWMYSHLPFDEQLDAQGVRHMELDLRFDWNNERFEVFHLPVIDETTNCRVFTECLELVATWSSAHPAHHPVVLQLEIKDGLPADPDDYWKRLHDEIMGVFSSSKLVTPADLGPNLGDTIASQGWPTLGELRGRVIFTMDNGGDLRDSYTHGGAHVDDRVIFPSSSPGDPFAAIAVINDPFAASEIADAIAANMLVRTRADAGVAGAQANDIDRRDAAINSGAHFITTDFPAAAGGMQYFVNIPDGSPSRCNPITAPSECSSAAIEDPAQL